MADESRPEEQRANERTEEAEAGGDAAGGGDRGAGGSATATPRYRAPAPYPPPAPYAPAPRLPAPNDAVPGYVPPAGRVWAPPAPPAAGPPAGRSAVAPPSTVTPLHALRPTAPRPSWGWKQSLWGLLLGMGPFMFLYAATYSLTSDADVGVEEVTAATALIFLFSAAIGYGWQLFAAWLFSVRSADHKLRAWGFRRPTAAIFWTIPLALVAAYIVSYANDLVFNPPDQDIVDAFPPSAAGIALFAVVAVVMAPLFEELYFRGFVFKGFANSWGWVWGAVVSGAVFSLAHLQLTLFVPLFVLGFALAWVYQRTGSLWTSIAMHAIFNGLAVIAWALTR